MEGVLVLYVRAIVLNKRLAIDILGRLRPAVAAVAAAAAESQRLRSTFSHDCAESVPLALASHGGHGR